jgi:predicted Zn-dependent protease
MRKGRILLGLALAAFALLTYWGMSERNPITGEDQHISLTQEQEIALGLQAAPEMAQQFGGLDPDESVQADITMLGSKLVGESVAERTGYEFRFAVLDDRQTVNAFALPGGPVFITRALLEQLENEGQLAGVLSHEIGHVIGRHSAEQISRSQLIGGLAAAVGVAASDEADQGRRAAALAAMVGQLAQMRYGRGDELQSDSLGVVIMSEAGYDPRALIVVMDILARASGGAGGPEFLQTHPNPGNRQAWIQRAIDAEFPDGVPPELTLGRPIDLGGAREPGGVAPR